MPTATRLPRLSLLSSWRNARRALVADLHEFSRLVEEIAAMSGRTEREVCTVLRAEVAS